MAEAMDPWRRLLALARAGMLAEAALWIAAEEYPDLDIKGRS